MHSLCIDWDREKEKGDVWSNVELSWSLADKPD